MIDANLSHIHSTSFELTRVLRISRKIMKIDYDTLFADDTKLRDSRNVKTSILSPISTKKEAIYLTNYPTYRGRGYVRNNNNNNSNNAIIEDHALDSSRRETFVVTEDGKENFIGKQEDRSNNFPSTKQEEILPTLLSFDEKNNEGNSLKRKIPRPANAFMLFANEWRKKLASENPRESNKDISVRFNILVKYCSFVSLIS